MRKLISIAQLKVKDSHLPVQCLQFLKKYCVSNSSVAVLELSIQSLGQVLTTVVASFVLSKLVVREAGLTKPSAQNPNLIQL